MELLPSQSSIIGVSRLSSKCCSVFQVSFILTSYSDFPVHPPTPLNSSEFTSSYVPGSTCVVSELHQGVFPFNSTSCSKYSIFSSRYQKLLERRERETKQKWVFKKKTILKIIKRALEQPNPIGDNNIARTITTPTEMLEANMLDGRRVLRIIVCSKLLHKWHKEQPYSIVKNI